MKRLSLVCGILTVAVGVVVFGQTAQPAVDAGYQQSLTGAVEHVYKRASGADLRLWVFTPADLKSSDKRPAIVFFGGGGWINQNPAQFSPQARHLASKGMVAVVADYRVRNPYNATPYESVTDAKSVIRWLRGHADELRIAPTSLAAGGGSAGGHVALTAALLDDFDEPGEDRAVSSKPDALVLFNPVPSTVPRIELTEAQKTALARLGSRARDVSPIDHLGRNLPPTIIFHGKADTTVPYSEVEAFCRKAVDLGNRCELVAFEGAGHGFFNPRNSTKWYDETLSGAEQFLKGLGYIR